MSEERSSTIGRKAQPRCVGCHNGGEGCRLSDTVVVAIMPRPPASTKEVDSSRWGRLAGEERRRVG